MLLLLLITDALMVALTSLLLVASLRREIHGITASFMAWLLGCFAIVAGAGVILGALGEFSILGFWCFHLCVLIPFLVLRRGSIKKDCQIPSDCLRQALKLTKEDRHLRWLLLALGIFCLFTGVLAAAGQPAVHDSISYRLPRIAHWLQEGAVAFIPTNDPRQNLMPIVPDIVMAWLLSGTTTGYTGLALAQWGGGLLVLAATIGLARQLGLSRFAAVASACLVAWAANVAPQFTSTHTDLITAGFVVASFFFWRSNACVKKGSLLFGLAAGLALGSKGTIFYFLPGLGIMALWYTWRSGFPLKTWGISLFAAFVSAGIFFVPGTVRNWIHYGGMFGPEEIVAYHHYGEDGRWLEKTGLNLASFLIQNLEPHSQMPGISSVTQAAGEHLINFLPEQDPFTFKGHNRRDLLSYSLNLQKPDADNTTFGIVTLVLVGLSAMASLVAWKRKGAEEVRVICAALFICLVFFHTMQVWHPYGHRYFTMAMPWIAVSISWFLEGIRFPLRALAWTLALASSLFTAANILYNSSNTGWNAAWRPEQTRFLYAYLAWGEWLNQLPPAGDSIYVALPFNRTLAPLYRRKNLPPVTIIELADLDHLTAEQALSELQGAWLVTSPEQFQDDGQNVVRRQLLFENNPSSGFSVAALRLEAPQEPGNTARIPAEGSTAENER